MRTIPRPRRLLAGAAALAAALGGVAIASPASAAEKTVVLPVTFSGQQPTEGLFGAPPAICEDCLPDSLALGAHVGADLDVSYVAGGYTELRYDDDRLRRGTPLDLEDELTIASGNVHLRWEFAYDFGVFDLDAQGDWVNVLDLSPVPNLVYEADFPCDLPASGTVDCSPATLLSIPLAGVPTPIPGLDVQLAFNVNLTISLDSEGAVTTRVADVVDGQPGTYASDLTFQGASPSTVADPLAVGCDEPLGEDVTYALTDWSLPVQPTIGLGYSIDFQLAALGIVVDTFANVWSLQLTEEPGTPVVLTAGDVSTVLGPLGEDATKPVADAGPVLTLTTEGAPKVFDGTATTDNCGAPTMVWLFSDGGIAFGPEPNHTFADDGLYSVLLTATDDAGNTDTDLVEVNVVNQKPQVDAGPDTTAVWGVPVPFGGSAVDPGSADQPTLTYTWSFGDGSPSAAGGPVTTHTYAVPATYAATLTVTDKEGSSDSDSRHVIVRKRSVTVANVGATSGPYATPATLKASVVDELGVPVAGRTVVFRMDGASIGSAATSSNGVATLVHAPDLDAGTHALQAEIAADTHYTAGASEVPFTVTRKATSLTYSGAVTGGPNKTIPLAATLVDATGSPLAGRTVAFQLGTQSTTATTDALGKAATTLKLSQKVGTYSVSATWTPAGPDADRYLASTTSTTFKLNAK